MTSDGWNSVPTHSIMRAAAEAHVMEALAFQVYRRFLGGETVDQLAKALDLPPQRIEKRLRVAALCRERTTEQLLLGNARVVRLRRTVVAERS